VIRYQVPAPGGDVQITIYNVRGQLVTTLVNGSEAPGFHTLTWDGGNDRGESVATGVYFVRMTAQGFSQTRKLVLIK
jgi:flagellar hook assembly protein FlgD